MKEFVELVEKMRNAQKDYFQYAGMAKRGNKEAWPLAKDALALSKALEARVDNEVVKHLAAL